MLFTGRDEFTNLKCKKEKFPMENLEGGVKLCDELFKAIS